MGGILSRSLLLVSFFVFSGEVSFSQKENYPKNYFSLPVYPGKPNTLSGALGDLRSSHFHAGIDVRTQMKEGLPVTAAAEGYVSRIIVSRRGYGKAIYVKHPNGMTTVYAHLKNFSKEIDAYVRQEQYRNQSFEVDLKLDETRFPVKREQLIAISGNTGSSEGPHLHFEIRDSRDNFLNPLFFGFPEIKDRTPPRFVELALSPADLNSRVNGRIDRQEFTPVLQPNTRIYTLKDTIRATGQLLLELQAFDRMDGTGFNYGLQCIELRLDGEEIFAFNMEKFPIDVGRDYNYLINYKSRVVDRKRYYRCYNPDNNQLPFFQTDERRGKLQIRDQQTHLVQIRIYDSFENSSELKFYIRGETAPQEVVSRTKREITPGISTAITGDLFKVTGNDSPAQFFAGGKMISVEASYQDDGQHVYLWNLKEGLPDSVRIGEDVLSTGFAATIPAGQEFEYHAGDLKIAFGERSVFEPLHMYLRREGNQLSINDHTFPLRGSIEVSYRTDIPDTLRERTHIYRRVNGSEAFLGGVWDGDRIRFQTRELGTFVPLTDTIPPQVRVLQCTPRMISARIRDERSGISSFRAKVNGEWVLMNYEYKNSYIWSEKADDSVPFEGEVEIEVRDNAGNTQVIKTKVAEPKPRR